MAAAVRLCELPVGCLHGSRDQAGLSKPDSILRQGHDRTAELGTRRRILPGPLRAYEILLVEVQHGASNRDKTG